MYNGASIQKKIGREKMLTLQPENKFSSTTIKKNWSFSKIFLVTFTIIVHSAFAKYYTTLA